MDLQRVRDAVDLDSHRPVYLQIAEAILDQIDAGTLAAGDTLPSKRELAETTDVAVGTVTAALDHLAARGHITTRRGTSARVAEHRAPVYERDDRWRHLYEEAEHAHHRWEDRGTPVDVHEAGIDWTAYQLLDFRQRVEAAPRIVAERLELPVGAPCLRREFLEEADGSLPRQIRVSWLDYAAVEGTAVEDPERHPWPGLLLGELMELGCLDPPTVERMFCARLATEDERRRLEIPTDAPVINTTWTWWSAGRCVETSDTVADGARSRPVVTLSL